MIFSQGQEAEQYITQYVQARGWKILARNYHSRFGEIDIIARDGEEIVFIEVKMRKNLSYGEPHTAVTKTKLEKMIHTAQLYLLENNWENHAYRLDVFGLREEQGKRSVEHLSHVSL